MFKGFPDINSLIIHCFLAYYKAFDKEARFFDKILNLEIHALACTGYIFILSHIFNTCKYLIVNSLIDYEIIDAALCP